MSFGDTTGFGLHADFTNGWNTTLLAEAIQQCAHIPDSLSLTGNCPVFSNYSSYPYPACMPSGLYPNEDVGLQNSNLTALPGCNPLWTTNSTTKPTCKTKLATPSIDLRLGPDLSHWNYLSCPFSYNNQGFMLNAHSHTNWANMTVDSCLSECKAGNYQYALMTLVHASLSCIPLLTDLLYSWGDNCYCDNEIRHNVSTVNSKNYPCWVRCPNSDTEWCGGQGSGSLYQACSGDACRANNAFPAQITAPASWVAR